MSLAETRRSARRAARFYDEWSDEFRRRFGTTLQGGLLKPGPDGPENVELSTHLLAARAGIVNGDRILDAGCGLGGPAVTIVSGLPDCELVGVTNSHVQVHHATQLARSHAVASRTSFVLADYHELPVAADRFDVALFFESIGYSPDHDRLFRQAAHAVRPGGTIYVKDVFAPPATDLSAVQREDLERFDQIWELAASPTLPGTVAALERAGCEIVTCGEIPDVGNESILPAFLEPDPDTAYRLSEFGRRFAMRARDLPVFFGEVVARVR